MGLVGHLFNSLRDRKLSFMPHFRAHRFADFGGKFVVRHYCARYVLYGFAEAYSHSISIFFFYCTRYFRYSRYFPKIRNFRDSRNFPVFSAKYQHKFSGGCREVMLRC